MEESLVCIIFTCRIRVPYPFQWGPPTFDAGEAFAMMFASFVALVEVSFCYVVTLTKTSWFFYLLFCWEQLACIEGKMVYNWPRSLIKNVNYRDGYYLCKQHPSGKK